MKRSNYSGSRWFYLGATAALVVAALVPFRASRAASAIVSQPLVSVMLFTEAIALSAMSCGERAAKLATLDHSVSAPATARPPNRVRFIWINLLCEADVVLPISTPASARLFESPVAAR